ncbi:hypothetical protein [Rhodococcus ruber]
MRLYPYPTLNGDVMLRIKPVALDGNSVIPDFIDQERRSIGISAIGSTRWKTLSFTVRVEGPLSELSIADGHWTNVTAVVTANCKRSNMRVSLPVNAEVDSPARWVATAELDRLDWFGAITISAMVLATVDGIDHRVIGVAEPWQISLDDLPRPPVGQAMTIIWENFADPVEGARSYLAPYSTEPYYLKFDPTDPVLFLNRGFEGLEGLLSDRRFRPPAERALHDHARAAIAAEAWLLLFLDALAHVEVDDGDVAWPQEDWRGNVLRALLESMYGAADDEALRRACEDWKNPDTAADVLERALPAASGQGRLARLLRGAIRTLSSVETMTLAEDEEALA